MKPKSTPAVKPEKKMYPKAFVMWTSEADIKLLLKEKIGDFPLFGRTAWTEEDFPVAILPFRTATEAREFVKVWEMETDEQIEHLAKKLSSFSGEPKWRSLKPQDRLYYRRLAMDALCALHFNTGEK